MVAIQVFQHGDRATAHANIRAAQALVEPGGQIAVRVNSTLTDPIWPAHTIIETPQPGQGLTVRYHDGPKKGLLVHFVDEHELAGLFADDFEMTLPLRQARMERTPPKPGSWVQHEGCWRRRL